MNERIERGLSLIDSGLTFTQAAKLAGIPKGTLSWYAWKYAGEHPRAYDWHEHTRRSLTWQYGPERAAQIINGFDPATRADLQRWKDLGRGRAL